MLDGSRGHTDNDGDGGEGDTHGFVIKPPGPPPPGMQPQDVRSIGYKPFHEQLLAVFAGPIEDEVAQRLCRIGGVDLHCRLAVNATAQDAVAFLATNNFSFRQTFSYDDQPVGGVAGQMGEAYEVYIFQDNAGGNRWHPDGAAGPPPPPPAGGAGGAQQPPQPPPGGQV